jgi:hypothetical protein
MWFLDEYINYVVHKLKLWHFQWLVENASILSLYGESWDKEVEKGREKDPQQVVFRNRRASEIFHDVRGQP